MEPVNLALLVSIFTGLLILSWLWMQYRFKLKMRLLIDAPGTRHSRNDLFQTLFEAAPECIKLQAEDGLIEQINSAGLAILETSMSSKIIGQSIYGVMAAEYHTEYRHLTNRVFKGGTGFMEFELVTFKGKRRWLETHAVPLRDEHGKIYALLAITRDIDKHKRMTQQLVEQRNRLNTIIESEPECVKLQDQSGIIIEMNPAGLALLSATNPDGVIGHSVYEFIREEYQQRYKELTSNVFNGVRDNMEFEVNTVTGGRRWLETHAAPLLDSNGRVSALLAITRDIDGRKKNELKLRNQQQELAHMCRLNTLGELASGLAHELKQPLCAISSYAESAVMLNDAQGCHENKKVNDILHKIVEETARASGIINGLRDFVRKSSPVPQAIKINGLLDEILELMEPERRRWGIKIDVTIPAGLSAAWVDRVQTQQIMMNLINNAIQAINESPQSKKLLEISVLEKHDQLHIEVRDFAEGISELLRPHLFTSFFTTKPEGIGIGLSLSRGIAEAQGGQLNYQSVQPGSVFCLIIPCNIPRR